MRNLSKVLALVLSLAFVMTMFSGALYTGKTYSDDADIASAAGKEAIAVLSALDIIGGRTDGTYDPTGDVQRQEFAKMITIATTGEATGNFYNAAVPFVDAVAEWALPYVSYCYLNGIMVGHGNNVADAFGNVTGVQAAKMTLVALGYNPKAEGLEGANWKANTIKLAANIGLLKNLEGYNMDAALNREGTAILVYNAIYTTVAGSKLTLGEKVFDLLDTYAILVANEKAALGVNWSDVMLADDVAVSAYKQYEVAAKGQSVFVYRDYNGAATVGGYYVPRAITVNLTSGKADLGMAYRVLTTGAQNPTNTNEVRKLYAVLGEVNDSIDYVSAVKEADDGIDVAKEVDKMIAEAQRANPAVDLTKSQNNCFINGEAKTYDEIKAWYAANKQSTAPFRYVDFDNDNIWDFVSVSTYTLGNVTKVTEDSYVITGVGTVKIADAGVELAEGDYVAKSALDGVAAYKKLNVFTGVVTAVKDNTAGKVTNYTINGETWTIANPDHSALIDASDKDYVETLIGKGPAAINAANLTYVADANWIVYVDTNAETKWDTYGVFVEWDESTILGMPQAVVFTEDNEYKHYLVKSINGVQVYNQLISEADRPAIEESLVKIYVDSNGYAALYTYDFALTNDAAKEADLFFENITDDVSVWVDRKDSANYRWEHGVVFGIQYAPAPAATADNADNANTVVVARKAYYVGEFQTVADRFMANGGDDDQLVYAEQANNVNILKAALVRTTETLPGLVLRDNALWGTVTSVTGVSYADGIYTYTVNILLPWSAGEKAMTVSSDENPLTTFEVGHVYKMYSDEDGIIRRWTEMNEEDGTLAGNNGMEMYKVALVSAMKTADGYLFEVTDGERDPMWISVDESTNVFFVNDLFNLNKKFEGKNYVEVLKALIQSDVDKYTLYVDMNPYTSEVSNLWIDTFVSNPWGITKTLSWNMLYSEADRKATYTVTDGDGYTIKDNGDILFNDGVLVLKKNYAPIVEVVTPDALRLNDGAKGELAVALTLELDGTYKMADTFGAAQAFDTYSADNCQTAVWAADSLTLYVENTEQAPDEVIKIDAKTQIWWVRDNFVRVDHIGGAQDAMGYMANALNAYKTSADVGTALSVANGTDEYVVYDYNPDVLVDNAVDAYSYEYLTVHATQDGGMIIVLHDTQLTDAPIAQFPYNATEATPAT